MDNVDMLNDFKTFCMIKSNENYKTRLFEAYTLLKENNIDTYLKFENCNIGIGAFKYSEITIFDRIKDVSYLTKLESFLVEFNGISKLPDDYGDRLASYGTVGNTPYRDKYIKNGWITTNLTEEEKNKFYK